MKTIFVTGGAGLLGATIRLALKIENFRIVNIDKLTYSGNLNSLHLIFNMKIIFLKN